MAINRPVAALTSLKLGIARSSRRYAAPVDPLRFGRHARVASEAQALPASHLDDDLRLFATTFAAGFLFVSVFIV